MDCDPMVLLQRDEVFVRAEHQGSARCHLPQEKFVQLGIAVGECIVVRTSQRTKYLCSAFVKMHRDPTSAQFDPLVELPVSSSEKQEEGKWPSGMLALRKYSSVSDARSVDVARMMRSDASEPELGLYQLSALLRWKYVRSQCTIHYGGNTWKVMATDPRDTIVRVTQSTKVRMISELSDADNKIESIDGSNSSSTTTSSTIGGYENVKEALREVLLLPRMHPQLFSKLGMLAPSGILLKGPAGVGKTALVHQMAEECNVRLIVVDAGSVGGTYIGEAESKVRGSFEEADAFLKKQPRNSTKMVAIFIDEIDLLCPHRSEAGLTEGRVVAQLLTLMDGQKKRERTVVLAATSRPNSIDPALRRPGRFDREIEMEAPSALERQQILLHLTRRLHLSDDISFRPLAERCLGFVGADLNALTNEAFLSALKRVNNERTSSEVVIQMSDFESALQRVVASSKRDIEITVPTTRFEDIGGLENVKQTLREAVEWPLKYAKSFQLLNVRPPRGILLHGPPGCSKTTLVKAVASSCQVSFLSLSGAAVYSPFLGSAEAAVRSAFKKARSVRPCIVFFDELDAIVAKRTFGSSDSGVQERVLSTLLNEMDGVESASDVLVVGATNRIDMIDAALLRPGRFDHVIEVPLPDTTARREILRIHTRNTPLHSDVNLKVVADLTEGYSGAELENVCREAALLALRENLSATSVHMHHLESALGSRSHQLPAICTNKPEAVTNSNAPAFSFSSSTPFQFV